MRYFIFAALTLFALCLLTLPTRAQEVLSIVTYLSPDGGAVVDSSRHDLFYPLGPATATALAVSEEDCLTTFLHPDTPWPGEPSLIRISRTSGSEWKAHIEYRLTYGAVGNVHCHTGAWMGGRLTSVVRSTEQIPDRRYDYGFDAGRQVRAEVNVWDPVEGAWNQIRDTVHYDVHGVSAIARRSYDHAAGTWTDFMRFSYQRDESGRVLERRSERFFRGRWEAETDTFRRENRRIEIKSGGEGRRVILLDEFGRMVNDVHYSLGPNVEQQYRYDGPRLASVERREFRNGSWHLTLHSTYAYSPYTPTGIDAPDIATGAPLTIYPNPATGALTVKTDARGSFEVVDLIGRVVLRGESDGGSASIDVSALPSGVYFVRAGSSTQKLIVAH